MDVYFIRVTPEFLTPKNDNQKCSTWNIFDYLPEANQSSANVIVPDQQELPMPIQGNRKKPNWPYRTFSYFLICIT